MVLAMWHKPVTDEAGNLVTGLTVEVRDANADGTPFATGLTSDRDGLVPIGNPFSAGDVPTFFAPGGCYNVRVYKTGVDETFYFQPVGTAAERDAVEGTGNVSGPDDSADGEVALFDGLTGKLLKRGGLLSVLWATMVHALTGKTTPVDADELGITDSAASYAGKRLTFANLATWIGTKLGPLVAAATSKTTPVDADGVLLSDSAASGVTKALSWLNLKATLKTYFDGVYIALGGAQTVSRGKPTTDVNDVTLTGLTGAMVTVAYAFTHSDSSGVNYQLQARVGGGTWRVIFSHTAEADATSSIYGYATIVGFNQAAGKVVWAASGKNIIVLGDSNDINSPASTTTGDLKYLSYAEVWTEIRLINTSNSDPSIEGSTTDQRGELWVIG